MNLNINLSKIRDDFTDIIITSQADSDFPLDRDKATAAQLNNRRGAIVDLYRNNRLFNAKVDKIVACLMYAVHNGFFEDGE